MIKKLMYFCCILISINWANVTYAGTANGRYVLVNKHSGKVIDVSGRSQSDGANVIQWSLGSGLNQRWDIAALGNGYYSIRAAHSGKSIDVGGNNRSNGANVLQWTYQGQSNQQWQIVSNGDGYYRILSRPNGRALEVADASSSNNGNIQMWDFSSADNQLWNLQPVGASGDEKTAFEITNDMDAGWNLGNTLDAAGGETNWGNPFTEKYMIDAIAARGFKTLRIPVTWDGHLYGGSNYAIENAWMDRVEKIVNYGLDNGMYVIINIHHDEWVEPTNSGKSSSLAHINAIWSQIATRFKNYNQYLVFETLNEPRANKGTSLEWSGTQENYSVVNELNAAALATIRASGGNNANRLVMVPAYAASPWNDQGDYFTVPNDNMVAVSTHGYIPYDFVENPTGSKVFTQADRDLIDYVLDNLNAKYISQGIPVVMGEWGTVDKSNTSERIDYAQFYATKAKNSGIPMIVWDNNALGAKHGYRLYDRTNDSWPFGDIADVIILNSN